MKTDIKRWNNKYAERDVDPSIGPDEFIMQYGDQLTTYGRALDLASGLGDNALYLAQRDYDSYCIDGSEVGMRYCVQRARDHGLTVYPVVADLDVFPLPEAWFDVIVVTRFLNRNLIGPIRQALRSNGWLLYRTFNINYRNQRPTFHPEYLLQHGELRHWFRDFICVDSNDSADNTTPYSHWVGHKP